MASGPSTVTRLLIEWRQGDESALERLMPIVYAELRRMAKRYLAGNLTFLAHALREARHLRAHQTAIGIASAKDVTAR